MTMKIAVIGAGNWGRNLVKTLHNLDALVAVAEQNASLRDEIAKQYPDTALYNNYLPLLENYEITAIAIATPAETHYPIAKKALLADKDVFVEKPFTLSVKDAEELVDLAKNREKVLMIGHLLIYQPAIQWIKQFITSGNLGTVYSLHQKRLNLGRVRNVENVLWSLGVHDVAALLFLIGKTPQSVKFSGQCALQKNITDDIYLHMNFGSVHAHLHSSWLWPEKERSLTVIGSKGMLIYDELVQTVTLHRKIIDAKLNAIDEGSKVVFQGSGEPLKTEMQHFIDCIKNRIVSMSDGKSALEVIKVLQHL